MDSTLFLVQKSWYYIVDEDYLFDGPNTRAILAGFAHNRRVMVSGYHGTAFTSRQTLL